MRKQTETKSTNEGESSTGCVTLCRSHQRSCWTDHFCESFDEATHSTDQNKNLCISKMMNSVENIVRRRLTRKTNLVDANILAQLREMRQGLREQRLQNMTQRRRIRVKSLPEPVAAPLQMIQLETRYKNVRKRFCYNNPSGVPGSYPGFVRSALTDAWAKLPAEFQRGCQVRIGYDFKDSRRRIAATSLGSTWTQQGYL